MTALFILICIAAPMLGYPWWPDVVLFFRWRLHLAKKRRAHRREWAAYKRKYPLL